MCYKYSQTPILNYLKPGYQIQELKRLQLLISGLKIQNRWNTTFNILDD